MAEFPNAIKAFTDVVDNVDDVLATHLNQAYDEIEAIETQMITYDTGWIPTTDSWSPTSDGTITIPAGGLNIYSIGDEIRYYKNGSSDLSYGYVAAIADTLLTPYAGSDYSVSSSDTLTEVAYSKGRGVGHPIWFNTTTPTLSVALYDNGSGGQPTISKSKACLVGRTCYYKLLSSGVKAGTDNLLIRFTVAGIIPTPLNTEVAGNFYAYSAGYYVGVCLYSGGDIISIGSANIADNAVMTNGSIALVYEI